MNEADRELSLDPCTNFFSVVLHLRKITTAEVHRLLLMGSLTTPEYGSLDCEPVQHKTQTGVVEHNGEAILEPEEPPPFREQARRQETTEPAAAMANDLLIQPDSEPQAAAASAGSVELDITFGTPVQDPPIWVGLYESVRDVFFPPKLPPLVLTSTPIPVPDRMAVKRNPLAWGIASFFNVGILALMIVVGVKSYINSTAKPPTVVETPIDLTEFKAPKSDSLAHGGGGSPDKVEAIKGKIPPRMQVPEIAPNIEPPLPSIDVQKDIIIPDNPTLPNFGMSKSANVSLASAGNGNGMGMGPGNGNGYGPGSGGNIGGGVYSVGGGVSTPQLIHSVEAEFSDEARRAKYQGVCIVSIIVDRNGVPQNPRVVRPLGMGLDEKALEAIKQYRFKPAMKDGKTPVPVMINVEIDFRLY
jgi:TonB family protein